MSKPTYEVRKRYEDKTFDKVLLRLPKPLMQEIKQHCAKLAAEAGEVDKRQRQPGSINNFFWRLAEEELKRKDTETIPNE